MQAEACPASKENERTHKSLADPYPRTPATAAGVADHIWRCEEIAALLD
jgi:hypothetical protein